MIAVWICTALAVLLLLNHLSLVSSEVSEVAWPGEAPAALHEDRARDQHITHLRRLLAADDPTAAHQVVTDLLQRMAELPIDPDERGLDAPTRSFLDHPPLHSPTRYRRDLDTVLRRIEAR